MTRLRSVSLIGLLLLITVACAGCLTHTGIPGIELRQTRAEVLEMLGPPAATPPPDLLGRQMLIWRVPSDGNHMTRRLVIFGKDGKVKTAMEFVERPDTPPLKPEEQ